MHLENIWRKTILISDVELGGGTNNRLIREERSKKGKVWLPERNTWRLHRKQETGKGVSSVYLNGNLLPEKGAESGIRVCEF